MLPADECKVFSCLGGLQVRCSFPPPLYSLRTAISCGGEYFKDNSTFIDFYFIVIEIVELNICLLCRKLAMQDQFKDLDSKMVLLNFALAHCPPEEIQLILKERSVIEVEVWNSCFACGFKVFELLHGIFSSSDSLPQVSEWCSGRGWDWWQCRYWGPGGERGAANHESRGWSSSATDGTKVRVRSWE